MKEKKTFGVAISALIAITYTILAATFDRAAIGPEDTVVGFSHMNGTFASFFGYNEVLYLISEIVGYSIIASIMIFVCIGFVQLIKTKKLSGVNADIYMYGIIVAALLAVYVLFEKVIINYRPIIAPGETAPEASFPSSHTMLSCTIMGITIVYILRNVKNEKTRRILVIICAVLALTVILCRLFSGVHWISDILGGLLWSALLVCGYIRLCAMQK